MKPYTIGLEKIDGSDSHRFDIPATSMSDALSKLVTGKKKIYVENGSTISGKPKMKLESFVPGGEYIITEARTYGMEFPEVVGKTV